MAPHALSAPICPCGTGLRAERCCELVTPQLRDTPGLKHLLPVVQQAMQSFQAGDRATAERLCLDVLDLAPGQTDALATLYRIRAAAGQHRPAETLLRRLVAVDPNIFWATNDLTLMLMAQGKLAEAEIHARNAVRIAPEDPQAHNLMGMVRGGEVTITKRGVPVARLVPVTPLFDRERARRAAAGLLEASRGARLDGLTIKELVDEGRS